MDWKRKTWVKRLLKLLLTVAIFCISYVLIDSGRIDLNKGDTVLGTIITSLGIIIAIVTTFIFSKIFSERNERIERKKLIDLYSKKLTSLRRLSHKIQTHTDTLWLNTTPSKITRLYPDLTLWSYRDGDYEKYKEIREKTKLGEEIIQAYLAAKLIEGDRPLEYMLNPTYHRNYSLDEIATYREASIFIYSFLSYHQDDIKLEHLHEYWVTGLEEEVQRINNNREKLTTKSLYLVFNDAYSDYLVRLYQLTQKNSKSVGTSFEGLFVDLIVASFITGLSVYVLSFTLCDSVKETLIKISLAGLFTVITDILINTIVSATKELTIEEFYE